MKKILCIAAAIVMCLSLVSCGEEPAGEITRASLPVTTSMYINSFNDCADDTDYALGIYNGNDEGTLTVATTDEYTSVKCAETDGKLTQIEVTGRGIFRQGAAAYDYMVYSVIACDNKLDGEAAGNLVAGMYQEAEEGGDAVEMEYDDVHYSFLKDSDSCRLIIEQRTAE